MQSAISQMRKSSKSGIGLQDIARYKSIKGNKHMTQVQKTADLRYIVTLKNKPYIKIYTYRSSDDSKDYEVTTVHGKVSSCNTPATHPCYICKDAQAREDSRMLAENEKLVDDPFIVHGNGHAIAVETDQKGTLNGGCGGHAFSLLK
jgi:hypothetical protein